MSLCHGLASFSLASWQLAASWPFAVDQLNSGAQEAVLQLSTVAAQLGSTVPHLLCAKHLPGLWPRDLNHP